MIGRLTVLLSDASFSTSHHCCYPLNPPHCSVPLTPTLPWMRSRIEISDISADISAIYRISGLIETIFDTENRLQEKSRKIGEYRRYFGEISDFDRNIGRNIGGWETRARGNFFGFFWEIYRRYIGNIGDISEIYRKYR